MGAPEPRGSCRAIVAFPCARGRVVRVLAASAAVWDAYWVPQRNKNGKASASKTNIVSTVDAVRGD